MHHAGVINVVYCETDLMVADGFTKALVGIKHQTFMKNVGFIDLGDSHAFSG